MGNKSFFSGFIRFERMLTIVLTLQPRNEEPFFKEQHAVHNLGSFKFPHRTEFISSLLCHPAILALTAQFQLTDQVAFVSKAKRMVSWLVWEDVTSTIASGLLFPSNLCVQERRSWSWNRQFWTSGRCSDEPGVKSLSIKKKKEKKESKHYEVSVNASSFLPKFRILRVQNVILLTEYWGDDVDDASEFLIPNYKIKLILFKAELAQHKISIPLVPWGLGWGASGHTSLQGLSQPSLHPPFKSNNQIM